MMDGLLKADDGAALRFFEKADKNNFQSERQGRPVFDNVVCVEVLTPGSKESSPVFEIERRYNEFSGIPDPQYTQYHAKYRKQFEAWRGGGDSADFRGTPLSAWPALDAAMIATLNEGRVYTVEGLAAISDDKLRVLGMEGRTLRDRAIQFLAAASGNAVGEGLAADNVNLHEDNERLTGEVARLDSEVARLTDELNAARGGQPPAPTPAKGKGALPNIV
mgnify:FL=1